MQIVTLVDVAVHAHLNFVRSQNHDNILKATEYDKISANDNTIIVFVRNTMAIIPLVYG